MNEEAPDPPKRLESLSKGETTNPQAEAKAVAAARRVNFREGRVDRISASYEYVR
jgi:hypothetical protein